MIDSLVFRAGNCKGGSMNAIFEYVRKRAASTILVSYTVFWAIFHWQGIYATIFVDQGIIYKQHGLLKNEYVNKYFFGLDWSNIVTIHNLEILLSWVIPAALAYFYVWWLPKFVINPSYKKESIYKEQRKIEKIRSEKRIQDEEKKLIEKQTAAEEAKIELADKKAEVSEKDPYIAWRQQYDQFIIDRKAVKSLDSLLSRVYGSDGEIYDYDIEGNVEGGMSPSELLQVDSWGLATINNNNGSIRLTDKGKYFTRLYKTSQDKDLSNE